MFPRRSAAEAKIIRPIIAHNQIAVLLPPPPPLSCGNWEQSTKTRNLLSFFSFLPFLECANVLIMILIISCNGPMVNGRRIKDGSWDSTGTQEPEQRFGRKVGYFQADGQGVVYPDPCRIHLSLSTGSSYRIM